MMTQLSQLVAAEPKTADFCGEVLKFSTAPFRAGRSLEGSIDELVEQLKLKGDQQKPDDPLTAKTKADTQIAQAKLKQDAEKDKAELAIRTEEIKQKDRHKQWELETTKQVKMLELRARTDDDAIRMQAQNQKAMHDREKHQADMIKKQADVEAAGQKAQIAAEQMTMRRDDMAARQAERQAAQQFKQQQILNKPGPIVP
jgi:hypothetical protein